MAKEKPEKKENAQDADIWQDERFQTVLNDPRFKNLAQTQRKVKIDKRFESMFTDKKFNVKYTVDKYGRRVNKSNAEDLRKFYELDSSASSSEDDTAEREKEEKALLLEAELKTSAQNDDLQSEVHEIVPQTLRERLCDPNTDYARGEGRLLSDSSSEDESGDEDDEVLNIDHVWGELDADANLTEDSTCRLAICNMDWDRMRASDLMLLFSSFLPPGGSILSIKIYPSKYGKERMAKEEESGPLELVGLVNSSNKPQRTLENDSEDENLVQAQDSEAEEGDDYHMEKLRQYQLNRLRYYYAVMECDSIETADKIYKECDGIEYESSATRVDLRFIPDDTSFDEDVPTDTCTELPDTGSYKPRQFTTTALQQVKVDLTWDETALDRRELGDKLASGKLDEVNDRDLRQIVAFSSEEEEEVDSGEESTNQINMKEEKPPDDNDNNSKNNKKLKSIDIYKALLSEIKVKEENNKNKKFDLEFTWEINEQKLEENDKTDEDINEKHKDGENLTPIEKVLKKRNEKNRKRKEERKRKILLSKGIDPDEVEENSDSDSLPDGIDMNDPYFAEEFQNSDFVAHKTVKKQNKIQKRQLLDKKDEEQQKEAEELALLLDDDEAIGLNSKQHFSLDKILKAEQETKSKRKRRRQLKKSKSVIEDERKVPEDNFEINVKDERFNALYTSHLFNIDPTDSHFKKTKGMETVIKEKLKRRNEQEEKNETRNDETIASKRPKKQLENNILVKNLKRKIEMKQKR